MQPEVQAVTHDAVLYPMTINTPNDLNLTAFGGIWKQLGGSKNAGKGVQIAVLDTGEPAFARPLSA